MFVAVGLLSIHAIPLVSALASTTTIVDPALSGSWYALHNPSSDAGLTACALKEGGPCATHANITFYSRTEMPWWTGTTKGDDVCARLKRGKCQHVVQPDGGCHHNHCDHAANPGQMVFCGPDPTPADGWPCMDCSGNCGPCGTLPPKPGVKPSPNWQGCTDVYAKALPYCDETKSIDDRVNWLVGQMSLEEKISAISPQPNLGDTCGVYTCGKASVGLPNYFWLTETNTAVAAACYTADPSQQYRCATTFVGPMNMGASFNRTSWRMKGEVIGTEMRAFNNLAWTRRRSCKGSPANQSCPGAAPIGLTGFGPNINIARDPRFGRTSELPSEDPFHSGAYGREMIDGMQTRDSAGHPKMLAYLKHYTIYSREQNRMHSEANVTDFDLHDSYLAQYEEAFKANASGVMCSYDAINGVPACANNYTLNTMIRDRWNQPHAFVTTDCGAVSNMLGHLEPSPGGGRGAASPEEAAAWTINNGTDLEMGSTVWTEHMLNASKIGLVTEEVITRSVTRGLRQQFIAGRFDADVWSNIGVKDINSTHSQQVQKEAALQGMVLLQNDGLLPLKKGSNIAVIGPSGFDQHLSSDYAGGSGEGGCWPDADEKCIVTIAHAIAEANVGGKTNASVGVGLPHDHTPEAQLLRAALEVARAADVVVLAVGVIDSEGEGHDRPDINLPSDQDALVHAVLRLGKPTLLVLTNGGAISLDGLTEGSNAIVEAFDPAHNTRQLASLLFGDANNWGKLPVTIYSHNYTTGAGDLPAQSMQNYDMVKSPGRTYRYYQGKPIFPFGHGLSLTTFSHACTCETTATTAVHVACSCIVKNTGDLAGDEVVLVYDALSPSIRAAVGKSHPVPFKRLVDFERVSLAAGATATLKFVIPKKQLSLTTASGNKKLYLGTHNFVFSRGNGLDVSVAVHL